MKLYQYKDETVKICLSIYTNNHNTVVLLADKYGSIITSLSTNISYLKPNMFCVDINNCPTAEQFLTDNKIAEPCGFSKRSGFCNYPVYKLSDDFINEYYDEED